VDKEVSQFSFRVGVKAKNGPTHMVYNGLRFSDWDAATSYSHTLRTRWRDVEDVRVEKSTDAPNCSYPVPSDRYPVNRG
jgi:hypothetical protein